LSSSKAVDPRTPQEDSGDVGILTARSPIAKVATLTGLVTTPAVKPPATIALQLRAVFDARILLIAL